jgi:predicted nucleic acid-binding protein
MSREAFLDSSVLIDVLVSSHADHHRRASALIHRMSSDDLTLHISHTVLFETAYVLSKVYRIPRMLIADALSNMLNMDNLVIPEKPLIAATLVLWIEESPLSFADCHHLVLARSLGLDAIYSFDKKMGRYPGVERIEP